MSIDHAFTPVPVRARRDGWTPARQAAFVAGLAEHRCVAAACRAVGMSWQSAYRLRARPDAAGFAAAWDAALAAVELPDDFTGRALGGVARPITYRGRQVGERRRFDNRLAKYILHLRSPAGSSGNGDAADRYGAALAALRTDLAIGAAPCDADDSRHDVARGSSPFAPIAAATLPFDRRCAMPRPSCGPMLAEEGAEAAALTRPFRICDPP